MSWRPPEEWRQFGDTWRRDDGVLVRKLSRASWRIEHTDGRHADAPIMRKLGDAIDWLEDHGEVPWLEYGAKVRRQYGGPKPGAGRPRKVSEDAARITFDAEPELADWLDAEAKRLGLASRSEMLRHVVESYRRRKGRLRAGEG